MSLPRHTPAAVLYECGKSLTVESLEIPELLTGQVLVQIAYSGVCQTQILEARGLKGPDQFLPHTLGHEAGGTVLAVGPGVELVSPQDHVVLSWIKGPGKNAPGPVYRNAAGNRVNAGPVATFSQFAVVSENRCTRIAKEVPLHIAALLGCAVPTGAGIVTRQLDAKANDSIAIFGAGGIGLSAILMASLRGCSPIIAIDVADDKLEFAKKFGATHTFNAVSTAVSDEIQELVPGGVQFAIESSGSASAMELAFQSVKDGGGKAVLAGNLAAGQSILIDPFKLILGREIVGSVGGGTIPEIDLPRYAELFLEGKLPLDRLCGKTFPLSQINEALEALEKGTLGRVLMIND